MIVPMLLCGTNTDRYKQINTFDRIVYFRETLNTYSRQLVVMLYHWFNKVHFAAQMNLCDP